MAYGGPDRLDQVEDYYRDIRRGNPPPRDLLEELVGRYRAIGGGSPLSKIVERQRAALEAELSERGDALPVYAGMRHIEPRIGRVVHEMAADGIGWFVAIALAPQRSSNAAGYRKAVESALTELGSDAPGVEFIESWHDQGQFISALAGATTEALQRCTAPERAHVMFTAHSLPARVVIEGDGYPIEVASTAALVAARLGLPAYTVAFQSAGRTAEPWLGPEIRDEIRRLGADGVRELVVCPVGFVADHLEVLYDIDIEARSVAREAGIGLERARSMNDDPTFISGLTELVLGALPERAPVAPSGPTVILTQREENVDARTPAERRGTHGASHPGGVPPGVGAVRPEGYVFARAPMLVYWETTLSCGLTCRHCRATAIADRSPEELTTSEGVALLDAITGFGRPYPHLVFTGGDPLRRPDLEELVAAASERGIGASLAPAATPDMTLERLAGLKTAGIQTMSLSIDGSDAARHDAFRGVHGTFDLTMRAISWIHRIGLPLQVNTLVTDETLPDLPAIYQLMGRLGIMRWSLFFLITVGRGSGLREITPAESERLNHWLCDLSRAAPFAIKTTEATHYRRVAIQRMRDEEVDDAAIAATPVGRGFGVRDGNGIMFVAHTGTVHPSGFLPLPIGNVRTDDVVTLYRKHPVFVALRDVTTLKGRCGRCEYKEVCGGSRARAYAATGDVLEADPLCPYVPRDADAAIQ